MSASQISTTAIIYPGVEIGEDCIIEDFVIIGLAPKPGIVTSPTVIRNGAHIRSHSVIYAGNQIGANFTTGNKANIRELNVIGDNVSIGTLSVIEHHVQIGDGVRIHSQAFIPEYSELGEGAWIGPNVVLTNSKYPNRADSKEQLMGPKIGKRAVIGANATLLPGVKIGEGALVGAGAVVTQDFPEAACGWGNPAVIAPYSGAPSTE